jgi:hypothetical protein
VLMKHDKIDQNTFGMVCVDLKLPSVEEEDKSGNLFNSFGGAALESETQKCIIMFGYNKETTGWYNPKTNAFVEILDFPKDELK